MPKNRERSSQNELIIASLLPNCYTSFIYPISIHPIILSQSISQKIYNSPNHHHHNELCLQHLQARHCSGDDHRWRLRHPRFPSIYLVYKTQNKQIVDEGGVQKYFFHPFMQVAAMFLGEILALVFYFLHKAKNPEGYASRAKAAQEEGKQLEFNRLKFAIPALCDVMGSNLQLFALNFIAGSVYQMMRGGTIITTFIFSLIILKMKAQRFQIVGSALAFIGIAVVGVSAMVFSSPQQNET